MVKSCVCKKTDVIFSLALNRRAGEAGRMRILRPLTVIAFAAVAVFSVHAATGPLMKAVVLREYGGSETLKLQEVPRPEPRDDEVLVRVIAAGVNPVDAYVRQGMLSRRDSTNDR
ncbi:MAG: hypothetical protein DMF41_10535 [Verrucomicrobia bacterium]|nr:MAG: hypothetical protein DMF41_10535 [Verrucomicrobiota bacterium]